MERREPLTIEQIKSVKGMGFLHNKGTHAFSARVITENGQLTAEQMQILSEAARRFGSGSMAFTVRLTVELPGIDFDDIPAFRDYIAQGGMQTGGTGSRVRPVVACKGTTCGHGMCDTQGIATEIHKRFYEGYYDVLLPHKFKIAIGGCPNNCVKPDLNDLGIVSVRMPTFNPDDCRGCKKCGVIDACPMNAISMQNGKIVIDETLCNGCGECVHPCHFKILDDSESRFKVFVGGKWGKKVRMGDPLNRLFTEREVMDVIEKALLLFKYKGKSGERFGETVDRLGIEEVEAILGSDRILQVKEEILSTGTVAGAKC